MGGGRVQAGQGENKGWFLCGLKKIYLYSM
jgi:hypothetical protein